MSRPRAVPRRRVSTSPPTAAPRRRTLLDAVLRIVADEGCEALTHRRVATEAGVPLGSTTYYFETREQMLRDALRHHAAEAMRLIDAVSGTGRPSAVDDVVDSLVAMVDREFADRRRVLVEYELILRAARDADLARALHDYEDRLVARLADALEALGAAAPFELARTLIAFVRAFELEKLTRPDADVAVLARRLRTACSVLDARRAAKPKGTKR